MKKLLLTLAVASVLASGISAVVQAPADPSFAVWSKLFSTSDSSYGIRMEAGMKDGDTILLRFESYSPTGGTFNSPATPASAVVVLNGVACATSLGQAGGVVFAELPMSGFDFTGGTNTVLIDVFDAQGNLVFMEEYLNLTFS